MAGTTEQKSNTKVVPRVKGRSKSRSDPVLMLASMACLGCLMLSFEYPFFLSLLVILSSIVTAEKGSLNVQYLMPLFGVLPSFFKLTVDVIVALVTGKEFS